MSTPTGSLPLWSAIIININIMLGIGIFINTTELAKRAGALGCISYVIIGLLMLPLIVSITELLKRYPAGGFYIFGARSINHFVGFMSTWAYFTGKLASATLMIHTAVTLLQKLFPATTIVSPLYLDVGLIFLFCLLNTRNLKTGSTIQGAFVFFKTVPILFVVGAAYILFRKNNFVTDNFIWEGIPSTLPLVLYATVGFEAACSLSSRIKDARKNAPLAVLISYTLVIGITVLFQGLLYGILGNTLITMKNYTEPFPAVLQHLFPISPGVALLWTNFIHLGIALSALGGSYGILFSNSWNLYTLAEHGHLPGKELLLAHNKHGIPWRCVLAEGIICLIYLCITAGHQITLQQVSALGSILAYTISVLSLLWIQYRDTMPIHGYIIPLLALINCCMLIGSCTYSLYTNSAYALVVFAILLSIGYVLFIDKKSVSA